MTPNELEQLLGPPLGRDSRDQRMVWRYRFERRLRECRAYLGPIPLQRARTETFALELTFGPAGLERAVYRRDAPAGRWERTVVPPTI